MKANVVRFAMTGSPDVLRLETVELGEPGPTEVLVRQTAIGLNFMDVYHRSGQYPLPLPSGLGTEAAGVLEKVGANVSGLRPGDRVCYGGSAPGAYADFRIMPVDRLIRTPADMSDEHAAAVISKGMTVEYLLNRCYPLRAGQRALFLAAAGGVGMIAGQWGKALGAQMIGVAGGAEKCRLAREHGYAHVIDRTCEDIVARVKDITGGEGVQVVYDSLGKATFDISLRCLAPRGYFVSFGSTTGAPPLLEPATLQKLGSLYFTRPTFVTYNGRREDRLASAAAVFTMVQKGAVKIHVGQRYKLTDAQKAHADLEGGRTKGSSILMP